MAAADRRPCKSCGNSRHPALSEAIAGEPHRSRSGILSSQGIPCYRLRRRFINVTTPNQRDRPRRKYVMARSAIQLLGTVAAGLVLLLSGLWGAMAIWFRLAPVPSL